MPFYGLLFYIALFYTQPAGRYPFLAPLRLEFVLGSIMMIYCINSILNGDVELRDNLLNKWAFIFLGFLFATIPIAFVKSRALWGAIRVLKFFAVYLMIITTIDNEEKVKKFIYVYLSLIALLFVEPLLTSNYVYNNWMNRLAGITGYFSHPNHLGMITSSHIPFFYYLMLHKKRIIFKIACIVLIIMAITAVMLTQSRTAMVGVVAFVFFIWINSKKKVFMVFFAALLMVVIWQFTPEKTKQRFETLTQIGRVLSSGRSSFDDEENRKYGSMASRWELMERSMITFKENPILGVGLDCYISYSGRRWNEWFPPHNTYLQALAEFGIIGSMLLLFIIYHTIMNLRKAKKNFIRNGKEKEFVCMIITPITIYYYIYLLVSSFGIEIFSNFWWIVGGLSVVLLKLSTPEIKQENK